MLPTEKTNKKQIATKINYDQNLMSITIKKVIKKIKPAQEKPSTYDNNLYFIGKYMVLPFDLVTGRQKRAKQA